MFKRLKEKAREYFPDFNWDTLTNLGIGKTMLLWFLVISLVPLASLSFINYLYYYQGLNILSKKSLFTTSQLRVNDLNNYFQQADDYLTFLAKDQDHIRLFAGLNEEIQKSILPVSEFAHTEKYKILANELEYSLEKSWELEGLYDILLINTQGVIVFTMKEQGIVGEDLFQGSLVNTLVSKTCKDILNTGDRRFSDLEFFPPESKTITGILGLTVYDISGKKLGILAYQITTERIDEIIQYSVGFGSTARVYLVGLDLNLRSVSEFGNTEPLLRQREDNSKTRIWQASKINATISSPDGKPIIEEVTYYPNTKDIDVMGLYRQIDYLEKLGVDWVLVEEINTEEAHAVARELSTFAKISLVITTIFVFIISLFVTRRFVTPIKSISAWAKQVSQGELENKDIIVSNDEVGEMKHTFNRLVSSLQQYADLSQAIALGDYTKSVPIRSQKDVLAKSMNEMVNSFRGVVKQAKAVASGDYSTTVVPRSDQDTLGITLFEMTKKLRETSQEIRNQDWLKTGLNELSLKTSGEQSIKDLTNALLIFLAHFLDSQIGLLFVMDEHEILRLTSTFACKPKKTSFALGEGVIGQVAKEKNPVIFTTSGSDLPAVNIGPSTEKPEHFVVAPVLYEGLVLGVIQLGSFHPYDELKQQFLDFSLENIAIAIHTARSREKVEQLLITTQEQTNELAEQKEELRQINEELEAQTKALKHSEENLQHQQEELRVINEELEERTKVLELQRDDIRKKNQALQQAQIEIRQKAEALEVASKYKSEFLANMSHELRTPLNSILALSELLASNKYKGLNKEEIEFAHVINSSGKDAKGMPESIETDPQHALQIIKNLLSNAIKFTETGSVTLSMHRPGKNVIFTNSDLTFSNCVAFDVVDTGIGIAEDQASMIFDAFQQADGTISRKFGGTGLGLTISRSLSRLLGGEIHLKSVPGEGSTFTLYLPEKLDIPPDESITGKPTETKESLKRAPITDPEGVIPMIEIDQAEAKKADKVFENKKILIVDDDMRNVFVLTKILEDKKVKIVVGKDGRDGIEKLYQNTDTNLIIMDIMMPQMDGYEAMREIRKDSRYTTLPIIALTAKAMKGDREKCIQAGANDYLSKPVQTEKFLSLLRVWLQK